MVKTTRSPMKTKSTSIEKSMIDENTKKCWKHYAKHRNQPQKTNTASQKRRMKGGLVGHLI